MFGVPYRGVLRFVFMLSMLSLEVSGFGGLVGGVNGVYVVVVDDLFA